MSGAISPNYTEQVRVSVQLPSVKITTPCREVTFRESHTITKGEGRIKVAVTVPVGVGGDSSGGFVFIDETEDPCSVPVDDCAFVVQSVNIDGCVKYKFLLVKAAP